MNQKEIERENAEYKGKLTKAKTDKHGHEVYGEKPKRFTKEWWPYFAEYYKWHCIVIAVILILVGVTIYQTCTKVHYDATVVYVNKTAETDAAPLEAISTDVTGNGKTDVLIENIAIDSTGATDEYSAAMVQRLMIEVSEGDAYLYIMPKEILKNYAVDEDGEDSGAFMNVKDWLKADVSDDKLVYFGTDTPYAVDITGNKTLEACGIDTENNVLCVKALFDRVKDENKGYHDNAVTMANAILK